MEKGEEHFSFNTISLGRLFDNGDFRLTAFDIPEPKGAEFHASRTGWPWWIKITFGGIVFVGIAALFKLTWNKKKG